MNCRSASVCANVALTGTQAIGWKYLLVYCCWIFAEAVLIWILWPETSGRSLEELAFRKPDLLGSSSLREKRLTFLAAVFEDKAELAQLAEAAANKAVSRVEESGKQSKEKV